MKADEMKSSSSNVTIKSAYRTQSAGNWVIHKYKNVVGCQIVGIKGITTKNQMVEVGTIPEKYVPTFTSVYKVSIGHKSGGVLVNNIKFLFSFLHSGTIQICQYTTGSVDSSEFTFYDDVIWIWSIFTK